MAGCSRSPRSAGSTPLDAARELARERLEHAARAKLSRDARAARRPRRASSPTRRRCGCSGRSSRPADGGEIDDAVCCSSTRPSTPRAGARPPTSCRWARTGTGCRGSRSSRPIAAAGSPTTGPGQLVAYPIIDLRELAKPDDVHEFVAAMERAMIAALGDHGVEARADRGLTGVWVGDRAAAGRRRAQDRLDRDPRAAAGSPRTASRSTSPTTCSRSSGSCPAGSRPAG